MNVDLGKMKCKLIYKSSLLLLIIVLHSTFCFENNGIYISAGGIGTSTLGIYDDISSIAEAGSFSFNSKIGLITLQVIHSTEIVVFGPSPAESFIDIGLIYGYDFGKKFLLASASGGISIIKGTRRGAKLYDYSWFSDRYISIDFLALGFLLRVHLAYVPIHFLAIGGTLSANINPEKIYVAPCLSISIGRIRKKD